MRVSLEVEGKESCKKKKKKKPGKVELSTLGNPLNRVEAMR